VWVDGASTGRLVNWAHTVLALTLASVKRSELTTGFVVPPRREVVGRGVMESTFGWLMRSRHLIRDYERRPAHHDAMVVLWTTATITHRSVSTPVSYTTIY
jgi:hypothetical protein